MDEYKKTNREKSKSTNKKKFWCRCDLNLIGQFGKCSVCGYKSKKHKKNF